MREMRLHKREVTDIKELRKILQECQVMRLGTMDEEGMMVVPVNFGFELDEETRKLRLFFHSAREGRKADAFARNPIVAVEMDCRHGLIKGDYSCAYSYSFASIMGTGDAEKGSRGRRKNLWSYPHPGSLCSWGKGGIFTGSPGTDRCIYY